MPRITRLPPITFKSLKATGKPLRESFKQDRNALAAIQEPPGDPTPRQLEILAFIERYLAQHRMPPTFREMSVGLDLTNNGVMCHLKALEKKGLIQHIAAGRSRSYLPVAAAGRCPLCGRPYPKETSRERR